LKPKLIALNILLLAAIAGVAWQARVRLDDAGSKRIHTVDVPVKPAPPPPLAPTPKPDAPPATKYADVAMKDLFSKDRNPNVEIEAPKAPPPKPMPPLPIVYGVLGLESGTKAIMAEKSGAPGKPVRAGDSIGEFKIAALDTRKVTFQWDDKTIEKNIDDLMDRTSRAPAGTAQQPEAGPQAMVRNQPQQNMNPPPPPPVATIQPGHPGAELGTPEHSERACLPNDSAPVGTVVDGYKKVTNFTPFGNTCRWVPAQ
jgi:hypothetical protein